MTMRRPADSMVLGSMVLLLGIGTAHADWKGKGELGVVLARGNSDTDTVNAKFDMEKELEKWKHSFGLSGLYSTNADVETGNRYELHGQSDYKLTAKSYVLGALRYEDDNFSPYSYQAVASVGYGYRFLDSDRTKLSGEIGAGYRRTEDRITAETQEDAIARGGIDYQHKLTANSEIFDKLLVEYGSDNTFIQNALGIKAKINDSFAMSFAYEVRHNTTVADPLKNTDQLMTANLVFSF